MHKMIAMKQKLHSVGMCLSVEADTIFLSLHRVRDASLQDAGKKQTASFSTERHIPSECNFCFIAIILGIGYLFYITKEKE
jgi:hypothetical protein